MGSLGGVVWWWRGCGGVAVGRCWLRLCCVSCSSSTLWSMSLLCRSCFGVLPIIVQDRGYGVPQLHFLDKVLTCPLLRRQVQFSDKVVDMPVGVQ